MLDLLEQQVQPKKPKNNTRLCRIMQCPVFFLQCRQSGRVWQAIRLSSGNMAHTHDREG